MKLFCQFFLFAILSILSFSAFSEEIEMINLFNVEMESLNGKVYFLEDKEGKLSLDQVNKLPESAFQATKGSSPLNFGYSDSTYWIKIPVMHWGPPSNITYILEIDVPLMDSVMFYQVIENEPIHTQSASYNTPLNNRYINYAGQLFPFQLQDKIPSTIYLQIKSDYSLHIPLTLYSERALVKSISIKELLHSSFFGGMIVIIFYHLLVYLSTREIGYLNYIFYISAYLLFMLTERVHGLHILDEVPYLLNREFLPSYIWLSWSLAFQMSRVILKSKVTMPSYDYVIRLIIYTSAISSVISLFTEPATAIRWAVTGTIICAFGLAIFGYKATKRRLPGASLYFWAWAVNFTAVAVYALSVTGLLPYNLFTSYSPQLGLICHIILISLALGNKISSAQKLAAKANEDAISNGRRYENLFNNASDGCFISTSEGILTTLNASCLSILGYSDPDSLVNQKNNIFNIIFQDASVKQSAIKSLLENNYFSTDTPYTDVNKIEKWLRVSINKTNDKLLGSAVLEGTIIDISEKKARAKLEKERQEDVLLKHSAEASALSKTQFLANMSHELRTPLTAIIGYSESLKEDSLSKGERDIAIATIVRSGNHLLNLVNDMLDHANISGDSLEIHKQSVNLPLLLQDIHNYFKPHAVKKGLSLSTNYQFPIPEIIESDPTRLKQILINLTGNAIKFTAQGQIDINVSFLPENNMVSFSVKDTGIGLRPDQLRKIFDPFSQADPSTARMYGGTGLGLSISKKLSEKLGGEMVIHSEYSKGSEFNFTLQGGKDCSSNLIYKEPNIEEFSTDSILPEPPRLEGNLLLVSDCDITRKLIHLITQKTGVEILAVSTVTEAIFRLSIQSFDLIVLDINYQDDGVSKILSVVRTKERTTPVIVLTADVSDKYLVKYKNHTNSQILHKPINLALFYSTLSVYLRSNISEQLCDE